MTRSTAEQVKCSFRRLTFFRTPCELDTDGSKGIKGSRTGSISKTRSFVLPAYHSLKVLKLDSSRSSKQIRKLNNFYNIQVDEVIAIAFD